jgi:hypothetical protein
MSSAVEAAVAVAVEVTVVEIAEIAVNAETAGVMADAARAREKGANGMMMTTTAPTREVPIPVRLA